MNNDLSNVLKKLAIGAVKSEQPMAFCMGKVTKEEPLEITVDERITLNEDFLLFCSSAIEHTGSITLNNINLYNEHPWNDEDTLKITYNDGLMLDDVVLMLRCDGGQRYIVLDRLRGWRVDTDSI